MKKIVSCLIIASSFLAVTSSLQASDKIEIKGCLIKKTHPLSAEYGTVITYIPLKGEPLQYNTNINEDYVKINGFNLRYNKKVVKAYIRCNK